MRTKFSIETARLRIRELTLADAPFIVQLLNTPGWLRFIGDRGVRNEADAKQYLLNGPLKSYETNGFGLWHVGLRSDGRPVGMCGLINRPTLDDIDIGFALLPDFYGQGLAVEMAEAALRFALQTLKLPRVVAIVDPSNLDSIRLLQKIGLQFEKTIRMPNEQLTLLYFGTRTPEAKAEIGAIDALTADFFSVFNNVGGRQPALERLRDWFVPQGMIVKNTGAAPALYDLDGFIAPRKKILSDGSLQEFSEAEIVGRTEIFGKIAHRFCIYKKSGLLNGQAFEAFGAKTIQFVRLAEGWKITSVAWDDSSIG